MRIDRVLIGALAPLTTALLLAPGQVAAQGQSASAAAMLEEVVVTARRREENLQDLPLSIQAITADAMQAQGIYNIQQITDFAPNVVLTEDQRMNDTRFYVRGVGGGFSNPAQVFGVGMYIDGHYISGSLGAFMSTVDVERVEVLRGPQGTLFGKNTTGGALSLVTAKPGPEFESYVTLRAADYGEVGVRAMINAPITDNLFFRGNIAQEESDGWYKNKRTGGTMGGEEQQSFGAALRWEPSDSWTLDAKVLASYDRDENQGGQCVARPDQEMFDQLIGRTDRDGIIINPLATAANPAPFVGPDLTLGTADDVVYNGPGPFNDGFGIDTWGSRNDDTSLRTGNFIDAGTGLPGLGGSDLRVDALYPGASAVWLNSCAEDFASGDIYQSYQDAITHSNVDNEMIMLSALWESDGAVGPFENMSLQFQAATRDTTYNYYQDRDFGPGIIDHIGNTPKGTPGINRMTDEFEVIFNGQIGDRVNLTAGFYWFDDVTVSGFGNCVGKWRAAWDPNGVNTLPNEPGDDGIIGTPDDGINRGTINGMNDDNIFCEPEGGTFFHRLPDSAGERRQFFNSSIVSGESTAFYAHADFSLSENWNLAIGARAMNDKRGLVNIEPGGPQAVTNCTNVGNPLTACSPTFVLNRESLLNSGFLGDSTAEFDEVTPTISLTRHLNPGNTIDSGILYGTISEGYLTGAFNDELNPYTNSFSAEGQALVQSLLPFGPEFVRNYEVGFKATMFDGKMRLSADYFIMEYTDRQEQIAIDNPDGLFGPDPNLSYSANASSVDIDGIELELRWSPWDGGFFSLDAGTLNTEYDNFTYTDFISGEEVTPELTSIMNRTPDWTVTASVEHAFLFSNGGTFTPQLGLYMQADMEWWPGLKDGEQSPMCHQDQVQKWRFRASYDPPAGNWQAALYGYNITDEEIMFRCQENRHGVYTRFFEAPAQWGAEFTMRFGG